MLACGGCQRQQTLYAAAPARKACGSWTALDGPRGSPSTTSICSPSPGEEVSGCTGGWPKHGRSPAPRSPTSRGSTPPQDPPVTRSYGVVPIAPGSGVYDESGTRSPSGAVKFAFATFRSVRARRAEDDCVMVSSTPALLVLAARMGLGPRRGTVLIVDWLEVWTREQWQDYLGAARGLVAWTVQGMAVWATPTATCHAALVEDRLRAIRPSLRVLRSPGLIDASQAASALGQGPAHPPYALFVGRLIEDKNVLSIPAAISVARRAAPELRCIVVGGGPLLADLQQQDRRAGPCRRLHHPVRCDGRGVVGADGRGHLPPAPLAARGLRLGRR